jgi:hypothetical protein
VPHHSSEFKSFSKESVYSNPITFSEVFLTVIRQVRSTSWYRLRAKRWPRRRRNHSRWLRHDASRSENRVVGNEGPPGKSGGAVSGAGPCARAGEANSNNKIDDKAYTNAWSFTVCLPIEKSVRSKRTSSCQESAGRRLNPKRCQIGGVVTGRSLFVRRDANPGRIRSNNVGDHCENRWLHCWRCDGGSRGRLYEWRMHGRHRLTAILARVTR